MQLKLKDDTSAVASWKRGIALNSDPWTMDCCVQLSEYFTKAGNAEQSEVYDAIGGRYLARNSIDQSQFVEARTFAEKATKLDPQSAEAFYLLGESQLALRVVSQATEAFEKCLELSPGHGRARARLESLNK